MDFKSGILILAVSAIAVLAVTQFIEMPQVIFYVSLATLFIALLILFKAQASKNKELVRDDSLNGQKPELQATLDKLSELLADDALTIGEEAERVESLTKEAVQLMDTSFHNMHKLTNTQRQLTAEIISMNQDNGQEEGDTNLNMQSFIHNTERTLNKLILNTTKVSKGSIDAVYHLDSLTENLSKILSFLEHRDQNAASESEVATEQVASVAKGNVVSEPACELYIQVREEVALAKETIQLLRQSVGCMASTDMTDIAETKEKMTSMLERMVNLNQTLNEKVLNIDQVGCELNSAVAVAVRSLQFEDISSQSLSLMKHNISALNELAELLAVLLDEQKRLHVGALDCYMQRRKQLLTENRPVDRTRAVTQKNMQEGDIELF